MERMLEKSGKSLEEVEAALSDFMAYSHSDQADPSGMSGVYDTWAQNYDDDVGSFAYNCPSQVASAAARVLPLTGRTLDLAAGTGLVGSALRELGFTNLDALDGSPEMLKVAESRNIYGRLVCCLLGGDNTIPVDDNSYDGIVCTGSFLPGHLGGDAFPELMRILKPGGRMVILFGEKYLQHKGFKAGMEGAIQQLEQSGAGRLESRDVQHDYLKDSNGVLWVVRKTAKP